MLRYQALIFDLDGTLANTLYDIADAANAALALRKHPLHSYAEYRTFIGHGLRNLCERSLPQNARTETEIDLCHQLLMNYYREHPVDKTVLYQGIEEVLRQVKEKGMKTAVLSNKADELTQKIIERLGIKTYFDHVLGSRAEFPRKPNPCSAMYLADRLGCLPENILYIGDSGVDMQTAKAAQMTSIGVCWGFRSREELQENGACHIIEKAEELFDLICKLTQNNY